MAAEIDRRIVGEPVNPQRRCCCLLALLLACAPEGSLGKDGVAEGSSSGGSTTHASTDTGTTSASDSSTHASSDHGSSESTTAHESTSTHASSDASSSSGLASCDPTGSEDACELCLKTHCCDHWQVCVADELCGCALDCVQGGGALDACTMTHCMDSTDAFQPELDCAHQQCMAQCPWAA